MNKKIKLLQITHDLALGGLQRIVVSLCEKINRDVFDVSVLCLRELGVFTSQLKELSIPVYLLPQKERGVDYFAFTKVAGFLKQHAIDVVHTHNTQPFVDGGIGGNIAGVTTIVHTDHARMFPDKRRYMFAEWCMSHFVYKVVGVSDHTSEMLMKHEKIPRRKIITVPNGIDVERFRRTGNPTGLRRRIGLPPEALTIGFSGRFTDQKGLTYLLNAMVPVVRAYPHAVLALAGDGPLENDLRREASTLGIAGNVFFLGHITDIPEFLSMLDLYVLPSIFEGLPMAILEAMANGCPVVATDVGGVPMAVIPGKTGFMVPSKNPDELAKKIIMVLGDEKLRSTLSRHCVEMARSSFTVEAMTRKYENIYLRKI